VAGVLHKDGTVEIAPWYTLPSGVIDRPASGDFVIRVVDPAGTVLFETATHVRFVDPEAERETQVAPFMTAVPYAMMADKVAVVWQGRVVESVFIATKLLHDMVDAIPSAGFVGDPNEGRQRLHDQVRAIEQQLQTGDRAGAAQTVANKLKVLVEQLLASHYVTTTALEYERSAVFALIDDMAAQLGGM